MATLSLSRSKKLLESQGFKVGIVEYWHAYAHKRMDLYGLADLVALRGDRAGTTYIQCCGEDIQSHVEKMLANTVMPDLLKAGNPCFLWAWRKRGGRGERKMWDLKEIEFLIEAGQVVHREVPVKEDL